MATYTRGHNELRVGLLALVSTLIFVTMFVWLTGRGLSARHVTIYIKQPTAERLKKGDPVLFRGVPVGEVRSIAFARDGGVIIRAKLTEEVPMTRDGSASLVAIDVFGSQSVVLRDGSPTARALADGDTITGTASRALTDVASILGERAERLLGDTTIALVQGALAGGIAASRELRAVASTMRQLVAAERPRVDSAALHAASLATTLDQTADGAQLSATLANLERATATLSGVATHLDSASVQIAASAAKVNAGTGSAALLLNDRALYDRLFLTTTSLDTLVRDVRANPKRYVKLSIF